MSYGPRRIAYDLTTREDFLDVTSYSHDETGNREDPGFGVLEEAFGKENCLEIF